MRVFLDTNVIVSAFATRGLSADVMRVVLAEHELIVGEVVLVELDRVLEMKLRLSAAVRTQIDSLLRGYEVQSRPSSALEVPVRDPDDALVLASALEARADVLVSGDRHLLEVANQVTGLMITTPRGFWRLLTEKE